MAEVVVITAVGQDRPGMVAALAQAMYELGANLDDATMTRLHSAFATMVSASLPNGITVEDCRMALSSVAKTLGLTITVEPVSAVDTVGNPPDHLLSVYGADKPGIVYHITKKLAERGINITDMDTRRVGSFTAPLYIMHIEIASGNIDLTRDLEALRRELQVDITLKPLDLEAL